MSKSFALWNRRRVVNRQLVSRVWSAAALSRQSFWFDLQRDSIPILCVFLLRNLLRVATGSRPEQVLEALNQLAPAGQ
jgi:hypothetical protein